MHFSIFSLWLLLIIAFDGKIISSNCFLYRRITCNCFSGVRYAVLLDEESTRHFTSEHHTPMRNLLDTLKLTNI